MHLIVIPARYGSLRFPGKPLVEIGGRSMLDRTTNIAAHAARKLGDTRVVVATDDLRVAEHVGALGYETVMTSTEIASGTDRALAVVEALAIAPEVILNLQGDAPFTPVDTVVALLRTAAARQAGVATPVRRMCWEALDRMRDHKKKAPFSGTSCLRASDGRALWFSKTILPAIRDEERLRAASPMSPVLRHLGLYAYKLDALRRFAAAQPSFYEAIEGLEQLRFFEIGIDILAIDVEASPLSMSGIDTPADVALAESLLAEHGDPYCPVT